MDKDKNYKRSNEISHTIKTVPASLKALYKSYRELDSITTNHLQKLSDGLCKAFGVNPIPIEFEGRQPHATDGKKLKNKTKGIYNSNTFRQSITVYKFTAIRGQTVKPKTAIDILIHEVNHHIDSVKYKLNTIHTRGFYNRIKQTKELLSS